MFKNVKQKINIKYSRGFTLLETTVILVIVSIGLVGVLSLSVESSRAQTANRNAIMAYELAREGIELVRTVRDTNIMKHDAWDKDIAGASLGQRYIIDYETYAPVMVSGISQARLYLKASSSPEANFYTHTATGGNTPSIFSRLVTITSSSNYITVDSLVEWEDGGHTNRYNMKAVLFNWF